MYFICLKTADTAIKLLASKVWKKKWIVEVKSVKEIRPKNASTYVFPQVFIFSMLSHCKNLFSQPLQTRAGKKHRTLVTIQCVKWRMKFMRLFECYNSQLMMKMSGMPMIWLSWKNARQAFVKNFFVLRPEKIKQRCKRKSNKIMIQLEVQLQIWVACNKI